MMNVANLVQAIHTLNAYDAFRPALFSRRTGAWWASYLIRREMKGGDVLIYQGDSDRTMYFLESGTLQVYVRGTPRRPPRSRCCAPAPSSASRRCSARRCAWRRSMRSRRASCGR